MQIRRAAANDFQALQAVELACFETLREAGAVSGVPAASSDEELQRFLDEDLLYVACDQDGAAIAFSGAYVVDEFLYIAEVDVLPVWQGQGFGRRLIMTLLDDGRQRRLAGATLTTDVVHPSTHHSMRSWASTSLKVMPFLSTLGSTSPDKLRMGSIPSVGSAWLCCSSRFDH
ncbi:GNAT family N-acetyltransferase [Rhizobium halophilum]|uniref:GNAT family N-acetyltransferase n=1 Tax=Rhizobium halophilum TaxID=2846852 RepID=UPI001EFD30F7|nr:GNAT family N-acetyltransferase [Rhizobium halophilum]MCF6371360.1 GNAT family N-acetyltransferase [Rhizobium halophilum]